MPKGGRQVPHVATASTEAHMEHDGGFVVLGHALEHSVRDHGRRVSEPHHPPRQQSQPPRRGAAAQLWAGDAPRSRRLKDQAWRVIASMSGARSSMKPFVALALQRLISRSECFLKEKILVLFFNIVFEFAHTPSLKAPPQQCISSTTSYKFGFDRFQIN